MSLCVALLLLGVAGSFGTRGASAVLDRHLYRLLGGLPFALAIVTLVLRQVGAMFWPVAIVLVVRGAVNSAIPVGWSAGQAHGISGQPASGGGLIVAAIELAILRGGAFGGLLQVLFDGSGRRRNAQLRCPPCAIVNLHN